jgi:S-adenosylmethionine/arginine decarboxylase-like enzyme
LAAFVHRTADFSGVPASLLRDSAAIGGLLVAAAGAAGLNTSAPSVVRVRGGEGVTAALWLGADGGHMIVHTFPDTETLLLDLLVPEAHETEKAIDVFDRRLGARSVRKARAPRG